MGMYIALIIFNAAWAYNSQDQPLTVYLAGITTGILICLVLDKKITTHQEGK